MKKSIIIFVSLFILSISSFGQTAVINISHSNIRHPGIVYSGTTGITLTFNKKEMSQEELKALAGGVWILEEDFVVDSKTCLAIKAPAGTYIKKGKWPIKSVKGMDTCNPGYAVKK